MIFVNNSDESAMQIDPRIPMTKFEQAIQRRMAMVKWN